MRNFFLVTARWVGCLPLRGVLDGGDLLLDAGFRNVELLHVVRGKTSAIFRLWNQRDVLRSGLLLHGELRVAHFRDITLQAV